MISEWTMYWITRLDDMRAMAFTVAIIAVLCLSFISVSLLVRDDMPDGTCRTLRRLIKVLLPVSVIMGCVYVLVPSSHNVVAIKVIPAIVNSETTHRVTHETVEAALRLIDEIEKGDEK